MTPRHAILITFAPIFAIAAVAIAAWEVLWGLPLPRMLCGDVGAFGVGVATLCTFRVRL